MAGRVGSRHSRASHNPTVSGHKVDDDWLYTVVVPSRPGVRASGYANAMSKVEGDHRGAGDDNVLILPARED
jgi:hypothetical protein